MKKTTISMLVAMMLVLALSGCGTTETKPETADQNQTSQGQQVDESKTQQQQPEKTQEETTEPVEDSQKTDNKEQPESQTTPEQKTEETTGQNPTENKEEKLYYEDEFEGQHIKCKLPDKWIAKEQSTEYGLVVMLLDSTQNAGIGIQTVENNKDSAQVRAESVAKDFNSKVVNVKFGNNSYKRVTTNQKDKVTQKDVAWDYLICVVGTKAYYLSTPIYDQQATQELLSNIQFK